MKILGVTVSSGVIYYGALAAPGTGQAPTAIGGGPEHLVPAAGLAGSARLADAYQRITQDIRVMSPGNVILVGTRRHASWKYKEASERISLISMLMLSCAHEGVQCEEWSTEKIGKLLGVPAQSLVSFSYEELGLSQRPKYWSQGRGPAFAAAMAHTKSESER